MFLDIHNSKIIVDEILKFSDFEITEKIYLSLPDGSRKGPYIQKTIRNKGNLGYVYKRLYNKDIPALSTASENIPNIYGFSDEDGQITVIQEYVNGKSLNEFVDNAKLNIAQVKKIFKDVCVAVNCLHNDYQPAIIHRDIKPSNIIIQENRSVLIDFGIARNYNDQVSTDTQRLGTIGYAPPEQFGFSQTDQRSDIYSLGKVLEFMLDNSYLKQFEKSNFESVIHKACAFDPESRYSNTQSLIDDFSIACRGEKPVPILNLKRSTETDKKVNRKYLPTLNDLKVIWVSCDHPWSELFQQYSLLQNLAVVWDVVLMLFCLLLLFSIINTAWFEPWRANINSQVGSTLFFIALFGFFDLPLLLILLIKQPIRRIVPNLPYIKLWHYVLYATISCVVLLVFAGAVNVV